MRPTGICEAMLLTGPPFIKAQILTTPYDRTWPTVRVTTIAALISVTDSVQA